MKVLFILISALLQLNLGQSARILGIFQMPSYSHQVVFQPIWKELSLRGHQVTVITPNPLNDPSLTNLTEIDIGHLKPLMAKFGFPFSFLKTVPIHERIKTVFEANFELVENMLQDKRIIKIYNNTDVKYDLLLLQAYVSPLLYSLTAKLGAPAIGVNSMGGYIGTHYAMGNPNHPALYSEMYLPYNGELTFWERIKSTLYYLFVRIYLNLYALPKGDAIMRKYLGNDIPYLGESEKNLSMLFLDTNHILYTPRPNVPGIIALNQMHLKPPQPLEPELKALLDKAENGVIYFSLGSNVQSAGLPEDLQQTLIDTLADLPYTVLWKYEAEDLPNKPKNVIIRKWLNQQDVLAHPKIKLFVTQGGLQSVEEAVSRGVPMVIMPFISEQEKNMQRLEKFGVGVGVDYIGLTKDRLKAAIFEVLSNNTYKEKVKELHEFWNDQPMTGLQRAIWWSEYVIRHKGAKRLRSPTLDLPWYQFLLLDVIGAISLAIFVTIYIVYKLLSMIFSKFSSKKEKSTTKTKSKKNQ